MTKFNEYRNFGVQDFGDNRLDEVINCSEFIPLKYFHIAVFDARDKYNRNVLRLGSLSNKVRRFKTIHAAHPYIKEDDSKLHFKYMAKRFFTRMRQHKGLAEVFKHGVQTGKVVGII